MTELSMRKGSTINMTLIDRAEWVGDIVHEDDRGLTISASGQTVFFPWTSVLKVKIVSTPETASMIY